MTRFSRSLLVIAIVATGLAVGSSAQAVCVVDALEEDDTMAQANDLDSSAPLAGHSCVGDPDVFRVFIPEHTTYTVTVTPEAGFDVALDWLDSDGNQIGDSIDNGLEGVPESHPTGFTLDTVWGYRVRGAGGDEGSYSISLTGVPAPLSISALDTPVGDNLDWLDPDSESNTLSTGWSFRELGDNSNPRANFLYMPNDGTDPLADTYSYGTGTNTERAFGGLGQTLHSRLILMLRNDTTSTIGSLSVSYTGEQWRLGTTGGVTDTLDFRHRAAFGSFADDNTLDFVTPNNTAAPGALDGNAVGNKASVASGVTDLFIEPGEYYFLHWDDANIEGAEDGLGIDDLSITALEPPDTDDDDVPDASDLCPGTPPSASVDANGCAQSQLDDDSDGVMNDVDDCPTTASGEVGPDGCNYDVNVSKRGKGKVLNEPDGLLINCGVTCFVRLPSDAEDLVLRAKPKRGYRFVKWLQGPCADTKINPCSVTPDENHTVEAKFRRK